MSRRNNDNKGSWSELFLFVMIILCVYLILALFDSPLTGEGGREWGRYLRTSWGGASIVPMLFVLYVSAAKLLKLRIPRVPRQVLGTLQLYISFSFLLGLLRETGWQSERTLFIPGNFGTGLAKFFILNIGTFMTLLLVVGSFILSLYLFGSRILRISLPAIPKLRFKFSRKSSRRRERDTLPNREDPEGSVFTNDIPAPILKPAPREEYYDDFMADTGDDTLPQPQRAKKDTPFTFRLPTLKPAPEISQPQVLSNAVEIIDNALAMIDSGELKAPPSRKPSSSPLKSRKSRRPLPAVTFPEEIQNLPGDDTGDDAAYDEPVFPPPAELFGPKMKPEPDKDILKNSEKQAKTITSTLKNFGVNATVSHIITGASVIQYQLELAPGTKVNKIAGLSEDLSMSLAVMSVRIEAPILGTHYVGIEVPCSERKTVSLRSIIDSEEYRDSTARLPLPLGARINGTVSVMGLEEMPHILIAGSKGSGRSMFVNSCIISMCSRRRPEELRLILIDPRHVEFSVYDGMPHLMARPVSEPEGALKALQWAYGEMERRTSAFAAARVRNLASFNRKQQKKNRLPEIVIVINELSDLVYSSGGEIEGIIMRLAQKSGASGIYMMLSAQRPSPDVFTTMIKSNIPARAAFMLGAEAESKNIIGSSDAVRLTGKGDMLFRNTGSPQPLRLQAPYISEERIAEFTDYMMSNLDPPEIIEF